MKLLSSTTTLGLGALLTGLALSCSGSDGHPPAVGDSPSETGGGGNGAGGKSTTQAGGSKATGGKASGGSGDETPMGGDAAQPIGGDGTTPMGGSAGASGGSGGSAGASAGTNSGGAGGKGGAGPAGGAGGAGGNAGGAGGMGPGGMGGMGPGGMGGMGPGGMGGMGPGGMGGMGGIGMGGKGGGGQGGAGGSGGSAGGNGGTGGSGGSAGASGSGGAATSCHDDSFIDLSAWLPDPNPAYADPTLTVSCNSSIMSVTSNSVPQYKIDWSDPKRTSYANTLVPTDTTYSIPRNTVFNAVPKQATVVGGVGVAVNGVQISSPSASGGPLHYADPDSIEVDGDTCDGHPNPQGKYHYHALTPRCLFTDAENGDLVGDPCTAPSPIIGWIADGYPIYGPCECLDKACTQVVEMRSSYALAGGDDDPSECAYQDFSFVGAADEYADGDEYLDECSGHIGPNGDYHYHMTNEYPWTLRCYRGTPMTTMAIGHTYNNAAGANDCCFEKECIDGVFQNVGCVAASCTP